LSKIKFAPQILIHISPTKYDKFIKIHPVISHIKYEDRHTYDLPIVNSFIHFVLRTK